MASDNLLAGAAGFAEGLQGVLVPYMQMKQKAQIESQLNAQKSAEGKIPVEQLESLTGQKFAQIPRGTLIDKSIMPFLAKQEEGTTNVYDAGGNFKTSVKGKVEQLKDENGPGGQKYTDHQDKLEKDYRDLIDRAVQRGSGGLGTQDQKVNQAVHVRNLMDQYYDPKTGSWNIPKSQYQELATGVANLIAPGGQATDSVRNGIIQRTAKGDFNGAISYALGTTPAGSTQDVFKNLSDSVDRQGTVSEKLRENYLSGFRKQAPTGLEPARVKHVESGNFGTSYSGYLSQPPEQRYGQNVITPIAGSQAAPDYSAALKWANENPSDPRAIDIKQRAAQGLGAMK